MKRLTLIILVLISISLFSGCSLITDLIPGNKSNIVVSEKTLDITVDAAKAKSLGQYLLDSVKSLQVWREKIEKDTGNKTTLTLSVMASPDPEGMNEYEKNNYYMYVSYSNSEGLVHWYTFLINKDDNSILAFAENGDDTISVEEWAKSVGLN